MFKAIIAKSQPELFRTRNQAKLQSFWTTQVVNLVCAYAVKFDKQNGKSRWKDTSQLEMSQVYEYETFKDQVWMQIHQMDKR